MHGDLSPPRSRGSSDGHCRSQPIGSVHWDGRGLFTDGIHDINHEQTALKPADFDSKHRFVLIPGAVSSVLRAWLGIITPRIRLIPMKRAAVFPLNWVILPTLHFDVDGR